MVYPFQDPLASGGDAPTLVRGVPGGYDEYCLNITGIPTPHTGKLFMTSRTNRIARLFATCVLTLATATTVAWGAPENTASKSKPDSETLKFVDKPMPAQSSTRAPGTKIDFVVLHFCSDVLAHPDHPYGIDRQIEIFTKAPASANYLIDRDGTVYRLVPEDRVAWHAGKGALASDPSIKQMNPRSIGIEMFAIGSAKDMKLFGMKDYAGYAKAHPENIGFTDAQYATLNELLKEIEGRHPAIKHDRTHIIGHEEWAGRARRTDPGELFDWTKIGLTKQRPGNAAK
jgi:N-acetyl-anhydromuramyl-L-alanine amidase AmpD